MVRAVVRDGVMVPLDPLPAEWADGRELRVESADDNRPADLDPAAWLREMNELCADSTPDDEAHVRAVLAEQRRLGKERMRKLTGGEE